MLNASLYSKDYAGWKITIDQFPALKFNFELFNDFSTVCMEKYARFEDASEIDRKWVNRYFFA